MLAETIAARIRRRREAEGNFPVKSKVVETPERKETPANLPAGISKTEIPHQPSDAAENYDKKALKALAKARKKEAKKK